MSLSVPNLPCRDANGPLHPHSQPHFPLMELPFEIRLLVYRFTVPNVFREDMRVNPKAFRNDGPCYPALLRANKQLYHEVSSEFYGQVYFRLWINPSGWHFNGNNGMPIKDPLPSAIQLVGQLDLSIYLGMYSDNFNYTKLLSQYFRSATSLIKLRIRLIISIEFFDRYQGQLELLNKGLQAELKPLREAQGLSQVTIHSINHEHPTTAYGHENFFQESMSEMLAVMRGYLTELSLQMTCSKRFNDPEATTL